MNKISIRQAVKSGAPRRSRPYLHRKGQFVLTANFSDRLMVDLTSIEVAGKLSEFFTQSTIAQMMGVSVATVSKMIRVYCYNNQ